MAELNTTSYTLLAEYESTAVYSVTYRWYAMVTSQSITENKSVVSIQHRIQKSSSGVWGSNTETMQTTTSTGTSTTSFTIESGGGTGEQIIGTYTQKVLHDNDGSYTKTWKCIIKNAYAYSESKTFNVSVTIPSIPRATVPSISPSSLVVNGSNAFSITLNRASSSFTHTLAYSFDNSSWTTIASSVGETYSWVVPTSILSNLPTQTSRTMYIRAITYNGSTQIGDAQIKQVNISTNAIPTISAPTFTGTQYNSRWLRYKPITIASTITAPTGTTITTVRVLNGTSTFANITGLSVSSYSLSASGTLQTNVFTIEATDARGQTQTLTYTLSSSNYLAYVKGSIAFNSSSRGDATADISTLILNYSGAIHSSCTGSLRIAVTGGGTSTASVTKSGNTWTASRTMASSGTSYYKRGSNYKVTATLIITYGSDTVETLTNTVTVRKAVPIIHWGMDYSGTGTNHFDVEGNLIIWGTNSKLIWIDDNGNKTELSLADFKKIVIDR